MMQNDLTIGRDFSPHYIQVTGPGGLNRPDQVGLFECGRTAGHEFTPRCR